MPFKDLIRSLRDIADAVGLIEEFTVGMDFAAFREDPKTIAAVERKLLVISEAAIRLGSLRDEAALRNWQRFLATHLLTSSASAIFLATTPLSN